MIDRRFDRRGALGRRDEVLRLRIFRPAEGSSAAACGMLGWKGPHSKQDGYRHRAEAEARVADPEAVVTILERLGFTVSLRIERRVEVWRLGDAVLRLETYPDRKSTRLNSSHLVISYAVFCLKKKKKIKKEA